jgi:hypothetical protein
LIFPSVKNQYWTQATALHFWQKTSMISAKTQRTMPTTKVTTVQTIVETIVVTVFVTQTMTLMRTMTALHIQLSGHGHFEHCVCYCDIQFSTGSDMFSVAPLVTV